MSEAPRKVDGAADGLAELKSLLFKGEAQRLADIESEVRRIDRRVGDAPSLENSTAEILVEAFRNAEIARHRELADAVAPVVVAAIRSEIRNSRAMMVEALYPLTGQLVVAAVQNAFREMMATVNQRVDSLTSVERWKLQIRSRISGTPASELAMAQTARGAVVRVLFLEAGSGRLIQSWRADALEDGRADLAGGLIAAITGFAREALDAGSNELRTLDFGGRKTYLRNSQLSIAAAEVEGDLSVSQIAALNTAFARLLAEYGRTETAAPSMLAAFASEIDEAAPAPRQSSSWPVKILAAILIIALAAWAGNAVMHWMFQRKLEAALAQLVQARPQLAHYPLAAAVNRGEGRVEARGILPSAEDAAAVHEALKAVSGGFPVFDRLVLAAPESSVEALRPLQAQQSSQISALGEELAKSRAAQASALEALAIAQTQIARLQSGLAEVSGSSERLAARLDSPSLRLDQIVNGFAVFFTDGNSIAGEAQALSRLDELAGLLVRENLGIRIVGYTDASGGSGANLSISRSRAEFVAGLLSSRGVDRQRIVVVARAAAAPIADPESANRERNRRVTFERLYAGEETP